MTRVILVVALVAACKDKQQAAQQPPPSATPSASDAGPHVVPRLPQAGSGGPNQPVSIEEATRAMPPIEGNVILGLKQTSDQKQVHATWCIDGSAADEVARHVGQWMGQAGYTDLQIRGDAKKAGVVGDRDGLRLSMVVSASAAAVCKAPEHYFASATLFRP